MSWHEWVPSSGDDHHCTDRDCGVIVSDAIREVEEQTEECLVSVDCPVPPCTEASNSGPCVLVLAADDAGRLYAECSYCERRGDLVQVDDDEDADPHAA